MNLPLRFAIFGAAVIGGNLQPDAGELRVNGQLYALGNNPDAAKKAGLPTARLLAAVYIVCGGCAGLGGILALSQLGSVSPKFGELYEFDAITAAVLGAVLLKSIFNGLVIVQADPYLYPLITSGIIFLAVLLDSLRRVAQTRGASQQNSRLWRRKKEVPVLWSR